MTIKNTNSNIFCATAGTKCYNLSRVDMTKSLSTYQEEAGTQMFLHAQYALNHLQGNIIINSPDTDAFIIINGFKKKDNFKTRNKNKAIIICVTRSKNY